MAASYADKLKDPRWQKKRFEIMEGWIKVHKQLQDHWIWQDPIKLRWWLDILLTVNFKDAKVNVGFELYECKRGQSIHSLKWWAERWRVSKDSARNFLKLLEKDGMILHESLSKSTRITVCNYDTYQSDLHVEQTKSKRRANDKQTISDPIEEREEEKEEKEEYGFDEFWDSYDKKVGKKDKVKIKFDKLLKQDKMQIKEYLPKYVRSTPDKNFRKNPETFLNNEAWKDEIVSMFKDYDKEPTERLCYFLSKYSGQGAEIKAPLSRYEKEVRDFGQDAVKFLRYAD